MINWSDLLTNMAHNATLIAYICHLSVIYGFTMFYRHEKYVSQTPLCHLSVANKRFVLRGFVFRIDIIDGIRINFYRGHQSVTPCNTTYHPASSSKAPALLSPGTPPVRKQWWLHQCQFSFSKRAMLQTQKQLVTSCDELHHVTLASSSSGKLWKSCVVSSMCCFFQSGSPWPWAVVSWSPQLGLEAPRRMDFRFQGNISIWQYDRLEIYWNMKVVCGCICLFYMWMSYIYIISYMSIVLNSFHIMFSCQFQPAFLAPAVAPASRCHLNDLLVHQRHGNFHHVLGQGDRGNLRFEIKGWA